MLIELELAALVALQLVALARREPQQVERDRAPATQDVVSHRSEHGDSVTSRDVTTHEIVKRVGDTWHSIGHRHGQHPDVAEALATPGLAVRRADGSIHEGRQ